MNYDLLSLLPALFMGYDDQVRDYYEQHPEEAVPPEFRAMVPQRATSPQQAMSAGAMNRMGPHPQSVGVAQQPPQGPQGLVVQPPVAQQPGVQQQAGNPGLMQVLSGGGVDPSVRESLIPGLRDPYGQFTPPGWGAETSRMSQNAIRQNRGNALLGVASSLLANVTNPVQGMAQAAEKLQGYASPQTIEDQVSQARNAELRDVVSNRLRDAVSQAQAANLAKEEYKSRTLAEIQAARHDKARRFMESKNATPAQLAAFDMDPDYYNVWAKANGFLETDSTDIRWDLERGVGVNTVTGEKIELTGDVSKDFHDWLFYHSTQDFMRGIPLSQLPVQIRMEIQQALASDDPTVVQAARDRMAELGVGTPTSEEIFDRFTEQVLKPQAELRKRFGAYDPIQFPWLPQVTEESVPPPSTAPIPALEQAQSPQVTQETYPLIEEPQTSLWERLRGITEGASEQINNASDWLFGGWFDEDEEEEEKRRKPIWGGWRE